MGINDGIICSDGQLYTHDNIRLIFEEASILRQTPKIYLIDACREFIEKETVNTIADSIRGNPETNSITLFGTSNGNTVKVAQVLKYFTQQMQQIYNKNKNVNDASKWDKLYDICKKVIKTIEKQTENDHEQTLILTEHDIDIDDVIFMPNEFEEELRGHKYDSDYLDEKWTVNLY